MVPVLFQSDERLEQKEEGQTVYHAMERRGGLDY